MRASANGATKQTHGEPFFKWDMKTFLPSFYIFKEYSKVLLTHAMNPHKGSRCIAPLILNLGTRCRWLVNVTPQSLYRRKEHWYPLNRRLGGPQSWSVHIGEKKYLLPLWDLELHLGLFKYVLSSALVTLTEHWNKFWVSKAINRAN